MAEHIGTDLPLLLTGEADRATVDHAAAHLRACEDCLHDLVSVVIAHASLESAHRYASELVPLRPIEADPQAGTAASAAPDLSSVFDSIRSDEARHPQRRRTGLIAAACVGALALGTGGYLVAANNDGSAPSTSAARQFTLDAFDAGTTDATATVSPTGALNIDATSLPQLSGKHYEVWMTNPGRTQLQPIGWVGADGKASMQVPVDFMSEYSDIEVSVQSVGSPDYNYSGTSVLRGPIVQ